MRGSPLLRALVAFVVLLFLAWPLWRLTHAEARLALPESAPISPTRSDIRLQLTFSAPATDLKVMHLGNEVWIDPAPKGMVERTLAIPYPKEGIDLEVKCKWLAGKPSAVRVRLTEPRGVEHVKTIWGTGEIDEVVTFP